MKPLLVSSGEPAGIGPDICLSLAGCEFPIVVIGDRTVLADRAKLLNLEIDLVEYDASAPNLPMPHSLIVWHIPCPSPVIPGILDVKNAEYVLELLTLATQAVLNKTFSALITAPIHKEIINRTGIPFSGHTEFLAELCNTKQVVMMLASERLRVALVTTHLPLNQVASAINKNLIIDIISILNDSLKKNFARPNPSIMIAGLNPHAGEGGYLGREEIDEIIPAIQTLQQQNIKAEGPYAADTLFCSHNLQHADAFVAMYHDQGLPVLKFASFGDAVNITLGLPIIRTSVDHGTALNLAGSGTASSSSLKEAVTLAFTMVKNQNATN